MQMVEWHRALSLLPASPASNQKAGAGSPLPCKAVHSICPHQSGLTVPKAQEGLLDPSKPGVLVASIAKTGYQQPF